MISTVGACTCNYLFAFTRNSPTIATSNTSAAKRGHNSPLRSVNVGTLRSICQRAVTRREKSTSSEMISTVGACTCNYLFAFNFAFNPAILSISCTTLRTAYFFFPGSDGESKSQPGVLETSNSGASALCAAGFGCCRRLSLGVSFTFRFRSFPAAECVLDRSAQIDQHAQGLSGGILRLEHHLPGLADHPQTNDRLLRGKLGAPAVDGLDALVLEFNE